MSQQLLIVLLYLLSTINSAPCIPANVCIDTKHRDGSNFEQSTILTCSDGAITQTIYSGNTDCSGSGASYSKSGYFWPGVSSASSSSGTLPEDIVQGYDCPTLGGSSDDCTEYMIIKKYGDPGYQVDSASKPYEDIGDDCSDKDNDYYDLFLIPIGCVQLFVGSNDFGCNSTHFWYDHYTSDTCDTTWESAQSDIWEVDTCGLFSERTHCGDNSRVNGGSQTICATGGLLQEFPYYIELVCCGDCDIQDSSQTGTQPPGTAPTTPSGSTSGANEKCVILGCIMVLVLVLIGMIF